MGQHVYWHAPLWQILSVVLVSLALLAWLVRRALRRPHLPTALSAVHPALSNQPLFYFDHVSGITGLNHATEGLLEDLSASEETLPLDVLRDVLLEAYGEARVVQQRGWPEPHRTLVAVPVFGAEDEVAGVWAMVTTESPPPPAERPVDEHLAAQPEAWLALGRAVRVHRTRPIVHVRRTGPDAAPTWEAYQLSPAEETLLRHLLDHRGEMQHLEELFRLIWPDEAVERYGLRPDQKNRLQQLVYRLRQQMEPDPHDPRYLCTAHGVGYVLYGEGEPANR